MPLHPCRLCTYDVSNSNCICCDSCDQWVHKKCSGLSTLQFKHLASVPSSSWFCELCLQDILPYGHLNDTNFHNILHSVDCKICPRPIMDDDSICCDVCNAWLQCSGLTYKIFLKLSKKVNTHWYCKICTNSIFPFGNLCNSSFSNLLSQKNKETFKFDLFNHNNESNFDDCCSVCNKHCKFHSSLPCSNCKHCKYIKNAPYH